MILSEIHPGMVVDVELPWGKDPEVTTLAPAVVIAVRHGADSKPGGFAPRPITVKWLQPPKIPGGSVSKYNTFDADKIRPTGLPRGRRGSVVVEVTPPTAP